MPLVLRCKKGYQLRVDDAVGTLRNRPGHIFGVGCTEHTTCQLFRDGNCPYLEVIDD